MMRSLYSAISGLKNHQVKMDVIGNNIANVNTTGFKRSSVTFATALSQTMKGASSPTASQGGSNPIQVGLGSTLGSINQIMTSGSAQSTGKATDMMLTGSGFFVLNNNGQQVFTRAGGFTQDSAGNLVDPATGAKVQGYSWSADDTKPPVWSATGDIKFNIRDKLATDSGMPVAELTTVLSNATDISSSSPFIFDGGSYTPSIKGAESLTIDGMTRVPTSTTPSSGQYAFDPTSGKVTFANAIDASATKLTIHYVDPVTNNATPLNTGSPTATVDYPPAPGAIVYNGSTYTSYKLSSSDTPGDGEYSVKAVSGKYQITFGTDGATTPAATVASTSISYDFTNEPHTLKDFSIDQSGVITGVYNNGTDTVTHKIGQIEVASFANDSGLQNMGGSFYTQSNNSGTASIGAAGEAGRASIVSGSLEMSNVDLSQEMTDMITAQRGFQANSRVITVSDSLLQELIDLKRQ